MPGFGDSITTYAGVAGVGGCLLGYDVGVTSGILAMDGFKEIFLPATDDSAVLDEKKGLVTTCLMVGCAIGALGSSYVADSKLGRRGTIQVACALVIIGAIVQCLSTQLSCALVSHDQLHDFACALDCRYIGRFVAGLGIGLSSALTPVFISEISPALLLGCTVYCCCSWFLHVHDVAVGRPCVRQSYPWHRVTCK
eukprot:m.325501 g.325501  ORF g.325501 m.325501 type:complete len:196 (-) comp20386_c0_seq9:405-992(-)